MSESLQKNLVIGGVVLAAIIILSVVFGSFGRSGETVPTPPAVPTAPSEDPTAVEAAAMCSADVKVCPDGSSVNRSGPNCEFAPCPDERRAGSAASIVDFESCVAAGNPVMESYPRGCSANGQTYREEADLKVDSDD